VATIAFDLNGTLLDTAHLAGPLGGHGDSALVLRALDAAVAQGMVLTLTGDYRPFAELIEAGLRRELELAGGDPDLAAEAVKLTATMPPFPEAEEALDTLAQAGHRLVVLTNSMRESAVEALGHAGLLDRFYAVHGTDAVGAFKPDPRVYALLGAPADTWLVAAHWWDCLGAQRAGLRTGWVARKERVLLKTVQPDVRGADLQEVATAITRA
jgi:2-haloacid dehalogenase